MTECKGFIHTSLRRKMQNLHNTVRTCAPEEDKTCRRRGDQASWMTWMVENMKNKQIFSWKYTRNKSFCTKHKAIVKQTYVNIYRKTFNQKNIFFFQKHNLTFYLKSFARMIIYEITFYNLKLNAKHIMSYFDELNWKRN